MKQKLLILPLLTAVLLCVQLAACGTPPVVDEREVTLHVSIQAPDVDQEVAPSAPQEPAAEQLLADSEPPTIEGEQLAVSGPAPESETLAIDSEQLDSQPEAVATAAPASPGDQAAAPSSPSGQSSSPDPSASQPASSSSINLDPEKVSVFRLNTDFTASDFYHPQDVQKFTKIINGTGKNTNANVIETTPIEGAFLVHTQDYASKFQYSLYKGVLRTDDNGYQLTDKGYDDLLVLANEAQVSGSFPQWLVYMNPNRVTGVRYHTQSSGGVKKMADNTDWKGLISQLVRTDVQRGMGGTYTPTGETFVPSADAFRIMLDFNNDVVYTLTFQNGSLYLESSDMSFGCRYLLSSKDSADCVRQYAETGKYITSENPSSGKPVIYLYPEKTQDVQVKLDFKGQLGYTFPAYNGGWNVTAQPDGTLTNRSDGSTHYYLFWDGYHSVNQWDFSHGFVVKGSEVGEFFQEKMPLLGLTPREYNDFITYWTPELRRNEYNLITFSTTQYEQRAPLTISPAPDAVIRVHMVYKPLTAPVEVKEQQLPTPPQRTGFTVVEWGGSRA